MIYQVKEDQHKTPAELLEGEVVGVLLHLGKVDVDEVPRLALVLSLRLLLLRHAGDDDENRDDITMKIEMKIILMMKIMMAAKD